MTRLPLRSKFFKLKKDATVYVDQDEEYGLNPVQAIAGWELFVADEIQKRELGSQTVQAVLFTHDFNANEFVWYWMPKQDFDRFAIQYDVRKK